jgi:DNA-binding response OmpR family regulator
VDNFINRLRQKLDVVGQPRHLLTVRGVGYRFEGDRRDG